MADNFYRTATNGPILITVSATGSTLLETMTRSGIPQTSDADSNPYTTSGQTRTALLMRSASGGILKNVSLTTSVTLSTLVTGQKMALQFMQQNIATSQASVAMKTSDTAGVTQFTLPYAGSIIGIAARGNVNLTSSTIRFIPTINGATVTGMGAVNAVTALKTITKSQARQVAGSTFVAGDGLGIKVSTGAAYAPNTNDWTCTLVVEI